jgi:hypothetical protein
LDGASSEIGGRNTSVVEGISHDAV